jgi:hypothetical protein
MAKNWTRGEGPYSKAGDSLPMTRQPDQGYPKPRDISRKVDGASKIDDGFSGKLPND